MIELNESINIIKDSILPYNKIKKVHILESINMILVNDIYSDIDLPQFNKSVYDGYAYDANSKNIKLEVVNGIYAGDIHDSHINENEAVKIMTGAKLPKGTNAVIKQEDTNIIDNYIVLGKKIKPYKNYIKKGEQIKKGELLIVKNSKITPSIIGMLASLGIEYIYVYEKLKIGILSTGNELKDVGENLEDGQIYDSNKYILYTKLLDYGYDPIIIGKASDDIEEIKEKIIRYIDNIDILITTGGVSVGEKDFIPTIFNKLNAEELFYKVNIKPGGSCIVSKLNNKLLFGLSGNPHASLICFESMVCPVLKYLSHQNSNNYVKAIFKGEYNNISPKDRYINGRITSKDANLYVTLLEDKKVKASLKSSINSNCLIKIEKNSSIENNQIVDVILI